MKKRTFDIDFKKEVVEYIQTGHTAYKASRHFGNCDRCEYDKSIFYQCSRKANQIMGCTSMRKCIEGAGRKPALGELEELLATGIILASNNENQSN